MRCEEEEEPSREVDILRDESNRSRKEDSSTTPGFPPRLESSASVGETVEIHLRTESEW